MAKKVEKAAEKPLLTPEARSTIGLMAGRTARQAVIEACNAAGLTVEKVAKTVVAGLDAHVVKAQLNPRGEWAVSDEFIDHPTRATFVDKAIVLLDLKPVEKHEVGGPLSHLSDAEIDRQLNDIYSQGKK